MAFILVYSLKVTQEFLILATIQAETCASADSGLCLVCMSPTTWYLYEHEEVNNSLGKYPVVIKVQQNEPGYKAHAVNLKVIHGKVGVRCYSCPSHELLPLAPAAAVGSGSAVACLCCHGVCHYWHLPLQLLYRVFLHFHGHCYCIPIVACATVLLLSACAAAYTFPCN